MKHDPILRALQDLEEQYIAEALEEPAPAAGHIRRRPLWLNAATCLAVVAVLCCLTLLGPLRPANSKMDAPGAEGDNSIAGNWPYRDPDRDDGALSPDDPASGDDIPPSSPCLPGDTVTNALGSVSYLDAADGHLTIRLTLLQPLTLRLSLRGYITTADGRTTTLCITTDPEGRVPVEYADGVTQVLEERPSLQIDGILSPDGLLPTASGTYEITVDYLTFAEMVDAVTDFCIDSFGLFSLSLSQGGAS